MKGKFILISILFLFFYKIAGAECLQGSICEPLKDEYKIRQKYLLEETLKGRKTEQAPKFIKSYPLPPSNLSQSFSIDQKKNKVLEIKEDRRKERQMSGNDSISHITRFNSFRYEKSSKKFGKIASLPIEVHPEKVIWIELSNTDVNRIVCSNGKITNVFYSQEKGILVKVDNDEAFIKFKTFYDPQTNKINRVKVPSEIYIRCAGKTYGFIARPRPIPSKTVYLVDTSKKQEPPRDLIEKATFDEAIVNIVRKVFTDRIPSSWERPQKFVPVKITKTVKNNKFKKFVTFRIKETDRYRIPGLSILVRVFNVVMVDSCNYAVVNEKLLLDERITRNPLAISFFDHTFRIGKEKTKAVIIERLFP